MLESQLLAIYENIKEKVLMHAHARFFFVFLVSDELLPQIFFFSQNLKKV
jgi:hypothetical protein